MIDFSQLKGKFISKSELQETFKISSTTVYNWQKSGKLNAYGLGKDKYYSGDEILKILMSNGRRQVI